MTISKEKFEAIALKVANELLKQQPRELQYGVNVKATLDFAHALIKRVEAECFKAEGFCGDGEVVTALPLVGE